MELYVLLVNVSTKYKNGNTTTTSDYIHCICDSFDKVKGFIIDFMTTDGNHIILKKDENVHAYVGKFSTPQYTKIYEARIVVRHLNTCV